jgi:hypothetical protein
MRYRGPRPFTQRVIAYMGMNATQEVPDGPEGAVQRAGRDHLISERDGSGGSGRGLHQRTEADKSRSPKPTPMPTPTLTVPRRKAHRPDERFVSPKRGVATRHSRSPITPLMARGRSETAPFVASWTARGSSPCRGRLRVAELGPSARSRAAEARVRTRRSAEPGATLEGREVLCPTLDAGRPFWGGVFAARASPSRCHCVTTTSQAAEK